MEPETVFYAGIFFNVIEKDDGKKYIAIPAGLLPVMTAKGADFTILNDIGEEDPEDVVVRFFASVPEIANQE